MKNKQNQNNHKTNLDASTFKDISKKSIEKLTQQTNANTECRLAQFEQTSNNTLKRFISIKSLNSKNSIYGLNINFDISEQSQSKQSNQIIEDQSDVKSSIYVQFAQKQKQNGFSFQNSLLELHNYQNINKNIGKKPAFGTRINAQPLQSTEMSLFVQKNCQIAVYLSQKRALILQLATDLQDQRIDKILKQILKSKYSFQYQRKFILCAGQKKNSCKLKRKELINSCMQQLQQLRALKSPKECYKIAVKFYKQMVDQMNKCNLKNKDQIAIQHASFPLTLKAERLWRQKLLAKYSHAQDTQQEYIFQRNLEPEEKLQLYNIYMLKQKSQRRFKWMRDSRIGIFLSQKLESFLSCWLAKGIKQKLNCLCCCQCCEQSV